MQRHRSKQRGSFVYVVTKRSHTHGICLLCSDFKNLDFNMILTTNIQVLMNISDLET